MPVPNLEMAPVSTVEPLAERIAKVFNRCFSDPEGLNTRLCGGFPEPFYRPAGGAQSHHLVEFTRDYPASALHEVAHWCVAGAERRQMPDYGYWYAPDGRTAGQQARFELVEVKPQALEWIFARACGLKFRVSTDNLESGLGASDNFKAAIWKQVQEYCAKGPNARAHTFALDLAGEFGQPDPLNAKAYRLVELS
ncbi:elongation factor P hydroxylase [Microbulbifer sp. GL-2]|uniref:elongation factor P hydroxylase n=1 Tax=Microbulbifer sp. GL-2 TaxID=2591606 RepID=UPI0011635AF5|nr:elongation factor P hydroxylase [Microbulbifer sp. GL-2]BBM02758.1 transporting ATPase [Microbulbifer sp. GL-2]